MCRTALVASMCLLGGIVSPGAAPGQGPGATATAGVRLAVGDAFPVLEGEYLSGGDARLPTDLAGRIAFLAFGFSYESRRPVEAWTETFRNGVGRGPDVTWLKIPMIGGMGRLAKPFITRGMRRDTPPADQRHVVTVYGTGDWKAKLGVTDDTAAHLVLLDAAGRVRWVSVQRTVAPDALAELTAAIARLRSSNG